MAKRDTYNDDLKWNTSDLYQNEEEFFKDYKYLENKLSEFSDFKGHILDSAKNLYNMLEFDYNYNQKLEQVYIYAYLLSDEDTSDTKNQTLLGNVCNLLNKYSETTSFIIPEILKSDYETINKYIDEYEKLKDYKRILKKIFKNKDYTLSAEEEKIISTLSPLMKAADDTYSYLTDADMSFGFILNENGKKEELNEKTYRRFIESSNRNIRKKAFQKLLNTYGNFKNTYACLLNNEVKKNNKMAEIRGFNDALNASLFNNDIKEEIYINLINSVKKNIKPLEKFWKIKKKYLKVNKLHIYDTYTPIVKEINKKYSEEEAKDLIINSLKVLGDDYITNLKRAFDERWIDFVPNDYKRNGAYCTACYNTHPYVLLSFDGSLNNVSTLTHELGHAMHYYYAINNQKYQDYNYSIFVAEVASQVNQILLSKYLINTSDNTDEKKYLIDDLINDFKAAVYRQTMFADFEKSIHELEQAGEILTHELLCRKYLELNKMYYGKNIVVDEEIKYEWQRIPHFYMDFYVYQYATAYVAAIKIAIDILNKKENSVENYLEFLKLGCTKTPIESLKIAGVDMTKEDTLKDAFIYFDDLINELERLYQD